MADWQQPIEAARVEVIGVSAQSERLLEVAVHLSNTPPNGWAELFTSCSNISVPVNLRASWRVLVSQIRMHVADADLESWVAKTKECVARANELYESEALPGLRRRRQAEQAAQSETERRLAEARRRADQL